jgi:hypothetical protein
VLGGAAGEDQVRVHVRADACDALLMIALRAGWSVAEVRRSRNDGVDAWAH